MRVFIYWNLNRKCWSIKALQGPDKGRVIAHAYAFQVDNATFRVSEAGRQRVLREQRKNVHAGVVGDLWEYTSAAQPAEIPIYPDGAAVTYNPYKYASFVRRVDESPVKEAIGVVAVGRSVYAYDAK